MKIFPTSANAFEGNEKKIENISLLSKTIFINPGIQIGHFGTYDNPLMPNL